jgi:hypothetical protein
MGARSISNKKILEAIRDNHGYISAVAEALKISRRTIYNRLQKSAAMRQAREDIDEELLDRAEIKLQQKIASEDLGAIIFFLKCKGKGRGYIEQQKISVDANVKNAVKFEPEAAMRIMENMLKESKADNA